MTKFINCINIELDRTYASKISYQMFVYRQTMKRLSLLMIDEHVVANEVWIEKNNNAINQVYIQEREYYDEQYSNFRKHLLKAISHREERLLLSNSFASRIWRSQNLIVHAIRQNIATWNIKSLIRSLRLSFVEIEFMTFTTKYASTYTSYSLR